MGAGLNLVVLLGRRLGAIETIATKTGSRMIKAVIEATSYRRGADGAGEEVKTNVPATLFGKTAELFESYVEPGHLVQLIGRLDGFEKKGKDGASWLTLSFVVEQLILLPNNRKDAANASSKWEAEPAKQRSEPRDWNRKPVTRRMEYDADGQPKDINF
jgi:single-stranded DNA-binding protein